MFTNRKTSTVWIAGIALALCSGAAYGVISSNSDDKEPGAPATYVPQHRDVGLGLSEDEATKRVLDGMGSPCLDSIQSLEQRPGEPAALHIAEHTDADLRSGDQQLAVLWEASLAQGAIAELMRSQQDSLNQVVGDADLDVTLKDGTVRSLDRATIGGVAAGQVFESETDGVSDKQRVAAAQQALTDFGLTPTQVEIRHPLGAALAVTASIPDDQSVKWTVDELRVALLGSTPVYEGLLLKITSPSGEPRLMATSTFRAGLGGLWFTKGQDDRFGAEHGGMPVPKDGQY